MTLPDSTTVAGFTVGGSAASSPLWWDTVSAWVATAYQPLMGFLGLVGVVLTIAKLWKENRRLDRERGKEGGK